MQDWEHFTPPGQPGPAVVMFRITVQADGREVVGTASHGWDVLAKLRNCMDRGFTDFTIQPITAQEAHELDPGPA